MFPRLTVWPRIVGIAFAMVVVFALTTNRAAATCGDYVHVDGAKTSGETAEPRTTVPTLPCHGPNCSQREPAPQPPVTAPPTNPTHENEFTTAPDRAIHPTALAGWSRPNDTADSLVLFSDPIFDPPRA